MNQRLFGFLFFLFSISSLAAQQIVPLEGYDFLGSSTKSRATPSDFTSGRSASPAEMDCDNTLAEGIVQVTSGDSSNISITIDTTGYPSGSGYFCLNCQDLNAGALITTSEQITYFSEDGIDQALDTLDLAFCTANADSCGAVETVIVLVQRAPLTFNFPAEVLQPQERIEISVPAAELPGGPSCREFRDCDDGYPGTEQLSLFLNNINQDNDFRYQAARYGGTDQVCLVVCNELGLCDQYNYFFEIVRSTVDLPFFDDFSNGGNRPRLSLWQNEDVLINRSYAIEPPSIGVATFDAVGPRGQPIGDGSSEVRPRDYLTSAGINLNGTNNPTLSFYYQARGVGNRPELSDSLALEFLHPDGNWRHAWSTRGRSSGEGGCVDIPFESVLLEIPAIYQYDGFQFRFFNYSNESGSLDHWHLDYVKLDDANGPNTLNLQDIALNAPPPYATQPYSAIPYRQLEAGGAPLLRDTFPVGVWNHAGLNDFLPANQSTYSISTNQGTDLLGPVLFEGLGAIPKEEPFDTSEVPNPAVYAPYVQDILSLDNTTGEEMYLIETTYSLDAQTQTFNETNAPGYVGPVTANNEITTTTVMGDYYAYDDGTSELAIQALPGQLLVQRYEAFTEEVLRGVSLRLPRTSSGNNEGLSIELVVYLGELESGNEPDASMTITPVYVENAYSDSLEGFTSYAFPDSIDIPVGPFYVGWRQLGTCDNCLPIGLDRNSNVPGTRFFRNSVSNNWFPFEGCSTGAFMIRPLVGNSPVPVTSVREQNQEDLVKIFPNPARDLVRISPLNGININDLEWELIGFSGQSLSRGTSQQLNVATYPAGVYVLRVLDTKTGRVSHHKLTIR